MAKPVSVLFVCLGNICRSPTAEGVFRQQVLQSGLAESVLIDSAGTAAYHVGEQPDPRSIAVAAKKGYELAHLRARQVSVDDLNDFDYVLAMDCANLADLRSLKKPHHSACVDLFLRYSDDPETEVPDPYYGSSNGFERVIQLIENAGYGLLNEIKQKLNR